MTSPYQVSAETIRTVAHGSITASFAAVGTPLAHPARLVCFTNTTDGDMYISLDGINAAFIVPKGTFKLFDLTTNRRECDFIFAIPAGTQFYVQYVAAPSVGSVYIEAIYGDPGR